MAVEIGHASTDGVEAAKQVKVSNWYLDEQGWDVVIRPKNGVAAQKMSECARAACNNDNLLYSQGQRDSFYKELVKNSFDISKINKCYADCSSFASAIAVAGDNSLLYGKDGTSGWRTGNIADGLGGSGKFEILRDQKYLITSDYLRTGDILVKEPVGHGGHATVVLNSGPYAPQLGDYLNLIDASGSFDKSTIEAIQELFELDVTGKIIKQPTTYQNYLPKHLFPTCEITIGNTAGGDPLVRKIQEMLGITADGYFGRMTINAIQRFLVMNDYSIGLMDGNITPIVIKSFQQYINTLIEAENAKKSAEANQQREDSQKDLP